MDIQEKYYELSDLKEKLEDIAFDLDRKEMQEYIDSIYSIVLDIEAEIRELEPEVKKLEDEEYKERENEYWEAKLGGIY